MLTAGFARGAARALADRGITVNVVHAGFMQTDINAHMRDAIAPLLQNLCIKRYGRLEEIIAPILFLASSAASYITAPLSMPTAVITSKKNPAKIAGALSLLSGVERHPHHFHFHIQHAGFHRGIVGADPDRLRQIGRLEDRHAAIRQHAIQAAGLFHERAAQDRHAGFLHLEHIRHVVHELGLLVVLYALHPFGARGLKRYKIVWAIFVNHFHSSRKVVSVKFGRCRPSEMSIGAALEGSERRSGISLMPLPYESTGRAQGWATMSGPIVGLLILNTDPLMAHGILLHMVFYLAAAVLLVPLAKRIGMGAVLGYLMAGALIGPLGACR